jgi:PAS domain S-box-containing protein
MRAKDRILTVDDDPKHRKTLSAILTAKGYTPIAAATGEDALERIKEAIPAVALIDLRLEDMPGLEVMRKIKEYSPDTACIVLTGYASQTSAIEAINLGAYSYVQKPYNVEHLLVTIRRAIEQRRDKEALRDSERRFRTLFDLSPQAITLTDMVTGRLVDVNDTFCELAKYTRQEILGRTTTACRFYSQEDRDKCLKELEASGEVRGMEVDFRAKDNEIIHTLMFAKVVRVAGESLLLTIFLDLTDRKRLEARLQKAQKMEAIGTLAGGIAHDFNNLLMGIIGNVSLMLLDIEPTHPHYKRLKVIEKQVQSGSDLTGQLLGYARKGRYVVQPTRLNQLVEETSEMFGRTKKEITIHRELAEDLDDINGDQGQIEQVLFNLYVNAADAMPGGGELTLKTMNTTHQEIKSELYDPEPGNYVLLTVTDTGTGMDKKTQERIFDPFFTTKEMGRGAGLGLASAYGIIKGHGGYIDVDSEKGHGATFRIYFPTSEKSPRKTVKADECVIKGSGTVLLVDDEEIVLEIGKELLEAIGYRVITAKDGKEAMEIYTQGGSAIDIVVLDMVMPHMDGGAAYDRMKEINPNVKVLLSSGYSIDSQATEILKRGCDGFIQKPFNMSELSRRIKAILKKDSE